MERTDESMKELKIIEQIDSANNRHHEQIICWNSTAQLKEVCSNTVHNQNKKRKVAHLYVTTWYLEMFLGARLTSKMNLLMIYVQDVLEFTPH